MSLFDRLELLNSIHPFDELSKKVKEDLISSMDIAYYPKGTTLISPSLEAKHLYIIIKGVVHEIFDEELQNVYGDNDTFDPSSLINSKSENHFIVKEELICYELEKERFLDLIQDYSSFKSFYLNNFVEMHQRLKERQNQSELTSFMVARVDEIFIHSPCIVNQNESILNSIKKMKSEQSSSILIKLNDQYGIVTDTNLRDRVLLGDVNVTDAIKKIATYPLITIEYNDFLFNALLLFTKHQVKRLVVIKDGVITGVLEQIDLLSFFANHTHLISQKIDRADDIDSLKTVESDMRNLIHLLMNKGVKVRYISKLSSELNIKIYQKMYELCVPLEMHQKAALIIMGSEGRGEQLLRSDQDNALILKDSKYENEFETYMKLFNKNLSEIGFPQCKGDVMVTNDFWRKDIASYKKDIESWCDSLNASSLQALSIFLDASCVAGECSLLDELREHLFQVFSTRSDILSHAAKPVLFFETPLSLFSNFIVDNKEHASELDIKKGGIFAIVHGVRILSLEHKIDETNTTNRIKKLNNLSVIDKSFATELIEAYDTLLTIRLKAMMAHDVSDVENLNYINPKNLDNVDRNLLKDSFKVVNKFKKFLTFHFHLNVVL